MIVYPKG